MGYSVSVSFDRFFYCRKREAFLQGLINRWHGVRFGFKDKDPADIEFYRNLSDEDKETFKKKLLLAMDLRNEIFSKRKAAIKQSMEMQYMDNQVNKLKISI